MDIIYKDIEEITDEVYNIRKTSNKINEARLESLLVSLFNFKRKLEEYETGNK